MEIFWSFSFSCVVIEVLVLIFRLSFILMEPHTATKVP